MSARGRLDSMTARSRWTAFTHDSLLLCAALSTASFPSMSADSSPPKKPRTDAAPAATSAHSAFMRVADLIPASHQPIRVKVVAPKIKKTKTTNVFSAVL